MKKTITALIILLPWLFSIALFTVTNASSVSANVPATGIVINNKGDDGIFTFDLANYDSKNPMTEEDLEVEVLPYKAQNRKYSCRITMDGEETNIVQLEDGKFKLNDIGVAKITFTSEDGNYSDSVIFNVVSSGVLNYTPTVTSADGTRYVLHEGTNTDYKVEIPVGTYVVGGNFYPSTVTNVQATYTSEDGAVTLNQVSGRLNAYFTTEETIVKMNVVGANGSPITKTIALTVTKEEGTATVNGKAFSSSTSSKDWPQLSAPENATTFTVYVDANVAYDKDKDGTEAEWLKKWSVSGPKSPDCTVKRNSVGNGAFEVTITMDGTIGAGDSAVYRLTDPNGKTYNFNVAFVAYDFSVYSTDNTDGKFYLLFKPDVNVNLTAFCDVDASVNYVSWSVSDQSVAEIASFNGDICSIKTHSAGTTTLTVKYETAGGDEGTILRDIVVSNYYTSLAFGENQKEYGLGNLAIASNAFNDDGNVAESTYTLDLYNLGSTGKQSIDNFSELVLTSSNRSVAYAYAQEIEQGKPQLILVIRGTGEVTVTAQWRYADRVSGATSASLTFTAVEGVAVENYEQLVKASDLKMQIVLKNSIYLGENLFDFDENGAKIPKYNDTTMKEKLLAYTNELETTFDSQYYKNVNGDDYKATIRYCLEFTNNVYGNGYTISAEYITDMLDTAGQLKGYAVFCGPLNFVAATLDGTEVASVKGQDNVAFLIRRDNVTLENVVLLGCDDEAIQNEDGLDLSLLNYVGTTLEVMCDATISNCRIRNGRTVVRIFGRDNVDLDGSVSIDEEKIEVEIVGCELRNAREFILKVGTNRFERGIETPFYNKNGEIYKSNSSICDSYLADENFVDSYVLTDVTLQDTTLSTSGLFAIGLESHFSGSMLNGADLGGYKLTGWDNLAGTSYPAVLRLVGNVVLDNWKELSTLDSSTLIETNISEDQAKLAFLSLNIGKMLETVQGSEGYEDIIRNVTTEQGTYGYAHGGIVFYGGGRNYSILDVSGYTGEQMKQYNINLSALIKSDDSLVATQGMLLPLAAGTQDFRFVMFDATSNSKPND